MALGIVFFSIKDLKEKGEGKYLPLYYRVYCDNSVPLQVAL